MRKVCCNTYLSLRRAPFIPDKEEIALPVHHYLLFKASTCRTERAVNLKYRGVTGKGDDKNGCWYDVLNLKMDIMGKWRIVIFYITTTAAPMVRYRQV